MSKVYDVKKKNNNASINAQNLNTIMKKLDKMYKDYEKRRDKYRKLADKTCDANYYHDALKYEYKMDTVTIITAMIEDNIEYEST